MQQEYAVEVDNVTKKFRVYHDKGSTLKEKVIFSSRNKYEERLVLDGISFQVRKGEAVGLVGHNGCGKSTTLKLLTKIMYPDAGSIQLHGRVSSLLELGAGFHPDMSGRENICINASIFGLGRKEIACRMDGIIAFSELEEFIDNPVRTYSSGMYMRLAFSVAVSVDADILLIDEILGVGDVNFQTKCFHKLMEIKGAGTTIVLVSHSTSQIERICDRSIWIQDGQIRMDGTPSDVHREYLDYMAGKREKINAAGEENSADNRKGSVSLYSVQLTDRDRKKRNVFRMGERLEMEAELDVQEQTGDYLIEINLVRADGLFCYGCRAASDEIRWEVSGSRRKIHLVFQKMNLLEGKYHFDLRLAGKDGTTVYFGGGIAGFEIDCAQQERGIVYLEHDWIKGQ